MDWPNVLPFQQQQQQQPHPHHQQQQQYARQQHIQMNPQLQHSPHSNHNPQQMHFDQQHQQRQQQFQYQQQQQQQPQQQQQQAMYQQQQMMRQQYQQQQPGQMSQQNPQAYYPQQQQRPQQQQQQQQQQQYQQYPQQHSMSAQHQNYSNPSFQSTPNPGYPNQPQQYHQPPRPVPQYQPPQPQSRGPMGKPLSMQLQNQNLPQRKTRTPVKRKTKRDDSEEETDESDDEVNFSRFSNATPGSFGDDGIAASRSRRSAKPKKYADGADDDDDVDFGEESKRGKRKGKRGGDDDMDIEDEDQLTEKRGELQSASEETVACELILARRPEGVDYHTWVPQKRSPGDPEDDEGPGPFEYLIKYKQASYLHIEWVTSNVLNELLGIRTQGRIKKFLEVWNRKREDPENDVFQLIFFDPQHTEVEKVIAVREKNESELYFPFYSPSNVYVVPDLVYYNFLGGKGEISNEPRKITQYMVKWRGLSYFDCTWETEADVDDDYKIAEFRRINRPPSNLRPRDSLGPRQRKLGQVTPPPQQIMTTITKIDHVATQARLAAHSRDNLVPIFIPPVLRPFIGAGETCGLLRIGDEIVAVNGKRMAGSPIGEIAKEIKNPSQSLLLRFYRRSLGSSTSATVWKSHELDVHFVTGSFLGLHLGTPQQRPDLANNPNGEQVPASVRITGFASPSSNRLPIVDSPLRRAVIGAICARGRNWTTFDMACAEIGCTIDELTQWLNRFLIDDPSNPGSKIPNASYPDLEKKLYNWIKRMVVVYSQAAKTKTTNNIISETLKKAAIAAAAKLAAAKQEEANNAANANSSAPAPVATGEGEKKPEQQHSSTTSSAAAPAAQSEAPKTEAAPAAIDSSSAQPKPADGSAPPATAPATAPKPNHPPITPEQLAIEHNEHVRLNLILGALWREFEGAMDERFAAEAERQRMLAPQPVKVEVRVPLSSVEAARVADPNVPLDSEDPTAITDSLVDLQQRMISALRRRQYRPYTESNPPKFKDEHELRAYQLQGVNWLVNQFYEGRNSILADEMGLGKTVQIVATLEHFRSREGLRGPFLIIAPLSTIGHWQREFEGWSNMNVCVYYDSAGQKARSILREYEFYYPTLNRTDVTKFNVMITTYELFISDIEFLVNIPWICLVVDEGHRIRSSKSKLLENLCKLGSTIQYKILLTGTPLQNNLTELWSLLNFCNPEGFSNLNAFIAKYSAPSSSPAPDGTIQETGGLNQLKKDMAPYILRRIKEDVEKSIPAKEETIIDVELTMQQKTFYRAIFERNKTFLFKGGSSANKPQLCNVEMELRKCCNHPYLIGGVREREEEQIKLDLQASMHEPGKRGVPFLQLYREELGKRIISSSGKLVLLNKLLPKLHAEGHKVLIFSQMVRMLDLLEEFCRIRSWPFERLDGGVRGNLRQMAIDRFSKGEGDSFIFLLSTRAGGVGINLTAADTVIIFDSDWNPQNDAQAQARCHRIGQKREVTVYRLVTKSTYEETMLERATQKLGLEEAVLGKNAATASTVVAASKRKKAASSAQAAAAAEGSSSGANKPSMSAVYMKPNELDTMLRKGALLLSNAEDNAASERFMEADIDQLLLKNTRTVKVDTVRGAITIDESNKKDGASSSSADGVEEGADTTGIITDESENNEIGINIDLHDPDFWKKVLPSTDGPNELLAKINGKYLSEMESDETKRKGFVNAVDEIVRDMLYKRQQGDVVDAQDMDTVISILVQMSSMKKLFGDAVAKNTQKQIEDLENSRARRARTKVRDQAADEDIVDKIVNADAKKKKKRPVRKAAEAAAAAAAAAAGGQIDSADLGDGEFNEDLLNTSLSADADLDAINMDIVTEAPKKRSRSKAGSASTGNGGPKKKGAQARPSKKMKVEDAKVNDEKVDAKVEEVKAETSEAPPSEESESESSEEEEEDEE